MIGKLPDGNSSLEAYRDFADVNVIVTDLDGTLIVGTIPILEQIRKKIISLKRMGVFTTIATGRSYAGACKLIKDLSVENGMPIALYNGSVLMEYRRENVISICSIPIHVVECIIDLASEDGAGIFVYTYSVPSKLYNELFERRHIVENVFYMGERLIQEDVNGSKVRDMNIEMIRESNVVSILLIRSELSDTTYNKLIEYLEKNEDVTYTDSGSGFVEVKGEAQNKGIIVDELRKNQKLGSRGVNKILAIGDNNNDVELLDSADVSVAVANSSIVAIEHADYICENEHAKGFLDMLTVIERAKYYYDS